MWIGKTEYDVLFGGSHYGRDADLLLTERIPEKRQGVPNDPKARMIGTKGYRRPGRCKAQHELQTAMLAYLETGARPTSVELAEALQTTSKEIGTAVQRLLRVGAIRSTPIPRDAWEVQGHFACRVRYRPVGR